MSKINARSPYYINFSATNLTEVVMHLYVYTGEKITDRSNFFILNSFAVNDNVTFEISEIVRDYILQTFNGDYVSENVWVDYQTNSYKLLAIRYMFYNKDRYQKATLGL